MGLDLSPIIDTKEEGEEQEEKATKGAIVVGAEPINTEEIVVKATMEVKVVVEEAIAKAIADVEAVIDIAIKALEVSPTTSPRV